MGQEAEAAERRERFAPYQVNGALMAAAGRGTRFMHCLPAHRGEEVTAEVFESAASVVFDQAENRLHAEKGILVWLTYPTLTPEPGEAVRRDYSNRIHDYLGQVGWETPVPRP